MTSAVREPRRAYRLSDDRVLGGVAAGVGRHLGVDVLYARAGFVVLALLGGFGVVVYGALWVLLPDEDELSMGATPPGLASATRRGSRTATGGSKARDTGVALSLCLLGLGGVVFLQNAGFGLSPRLFWPLVVAGAGVALLWWQSDQVDRTQWLSTQTGWKGLLRVVLGVLLVGGAAWLALVQAHVGSVGQLGLVIALAALGTALVIGPWLVRLSRDLRRERAERIRTQERADVAAHLHDSVLQTLALIQRQAGDAQTVVQLARTQERELRTWLFEPDEAGPDTFRAVLQHAVAEVEAAHRVPIELVVVGDAPLDEGAKALVAASREAMVNAARHSGASRIDVYAEVQAGRVEVGVRDRGRGFEPAKVPLDRRGVRGSIIGRLDRHGGRAEISSGLDAGTEVRMWVPLATQQEISR
jgi:phage shock protein PspC (stress-responsive transcriptional regulator)/signal transduction histidine kinase